MPATPSQSVPKALSSRRPSPARQCNAWLCLLVSAKTAPPFPTSCLHASSGAAMQFLLSWRAHWVVPIYKKSRFLRQQLQKRTPDWPNCQRLPSVCCSLWLSRTSVAQLLLDQTSSPTPKAVERGTSPGLPHEVVAPCRQHCDSFKLLGVPFDCKLMMTWP